MLRAYGVIPRIGCLQAIFKDFGVSCPDQLVLIIMMRYGGTNAVVGDVISLAAGDNRSATRCDILFFAHGIL